MYITDDGRWVGAVSGGCLEGDALRKARKVMQEQQSMLVTYDTMNEEGATLGIALGCNGVIDILIEPLDHERENPLTWLEKCQPKGLDGAMATVFTGGEGDTKPVVAIGRRWALLPTGEMLGKDSAFEEEASVLADLQTARDTRQAFVKSYTSQGQPVKIFFEAFPQQIQLVIFGGGYDAVPMAQMAYDTGWRVAVTDFCVAHLIPKKFPNVHRIVEAQPTDFLEKVQPDDRTALVLMSHDYKKDLAVLEQALQVPIPYIGILGPRKKGDKMFRDLAARGVLSEADHARIHSPMGLDIGAETPEEIAISVIAEVMAVFSKRNGQMLKLRPGPIHGRETSPSYNEREPIGEHCSRVF
jgi:xanthine/CO dehydrogenase XdhC/CoxF family maturation factor